MFVREIQRSHSEETQLLGMLRMSPMGATDSSEPHAHSRLTGSTQKFYWTFEEGSLLKACGIFPKDNGV